MALRRRTSCGVTGLQPAVVDALLYGYGDGAADPFGIFDYDIQENGHFLPRIWREHRAALLAEAKRRGIKPWAQERFDTNGKAD